MEKLILGIDTGGTFTDSVLVGACSGTVYRKAKRLTTHYRLIEGIRSSVSSLEIEHPEDICCVCLSTTLATNAVVEGTGGRVGLIYMGKDLDGKNLPVETAVQVAGALDIKGRTVVSPDPDEIARAVDQMAGKIDAAAVSGFASVRNPMHENMVRKIIRDRIKVPVVCAHDLSRLMGFQERTVTAALNAALIPNITNLIDSVRVVMEQFRIAAPCMIVRGDGSLMLDKVAYERPIETVLSGPAASVVGASYLTGMKDAMIVDIGGTTTDIANISRGRVCLHEEGATVGGWKTQLKAAEISTHGIGGDSWIRFNRKGDVKAGPRRVVPLCVAGVRNPDLGSEIHRYQPSREYEIHYGEVVDCYDLIGLPEDADYFDRKLADILSDGPHSRFYIADKMDTVSDKIDFDALIRRGILQRCSLTPTDLLHAAGLLDIWNPATSKSAVVDMAYRKAIEYNVFLKNCLTGVWKKLRVACLQSTADFAGSRLDFFDPAMEFLLRQDHDLLDVQFKLKKPIVAIGAPVKAWMPQVADALGTELMIPEHAEVANAIGAAMGKIRENTEILIRPDKQSNKYRVHTEWEKKSFESLEEAEQWAAARGEEIVRHKMGMSGCLEDRAVCTLEKEDIWSDAYVKKEREFIQRKIRIQAEADPMWMFRKPADAAEGYKGSSE